MVERPWDAEDARPLTSLSYECDDVDCRGVKTSDANEQKAAQIDATHTPCIVSHRPTGV
jgi:hypothetical protein